MEGGPEWRMLEAGDTGESQGCGHAEEGTRQRGDRGRMGTAGGGKGTAEARSGLGVWPHAWENLEEEQA